MTAGTRILHSHRQALVLLERARVHLEDQTVVYDVADDTLTRQFNLPWRNISVLLLGQGTSITNAAMRNLADADVMVAFTGSGGAPLIMASHAEGCHRSSAYLRPWVDIWTSPERSLVAARSLQASRIAALEACAEKVDPFFDIDDVGEACSRYRARMKSADTIQSLMGHEGEFCRSVYAILARKARIPDFQRIHQARSRPDQDIDARLKAVNAAIDHGNYLAYGIAALVLWILGIPGNMPVSHGESRAGGLVYDLADAFKDAFVLPLAFGTASRIGSGKPFDENQFRSRLLDAFNGGSRNDSRVIGIAVKAMKDAISAAGIEVPAEGAD